MYFISEKNRNHSLANVFNIGNVREIMHNGDVSGIIRKINRFLIQKESSFYTVGDFYQYIYLYLKKNYRNEYYYKNEIIKKIITTHSSNTTRIFNEFKVGNAIADILFINGSDRVFEIKTELDTDARLRHQIEEYKKAFTKIYIVIPLSLLEFYKRVLPENIGIYVITKLGALKLMREAVDDFSKLDSVIILRCLHKSEYTKIISKYSKIPNVKPVYFFRECAKVFREIPIEKLHKDFLSCLKSRPHIDYAYLKGKVPNALKYMFLNLGLEQSQNSIFQDTLNIKIN